MHNLTLQIYGNGSWQDAMDLSFAEPALGFLSPCRFWHAVCDALGDILNPQDAFERLCQDTQPLRALPDLLRDSGLPERAFNHPAIALGNLNQRLTAWGLQ